jgi:golgin subfamily B member 1
VPTNPGSSAAESGRLVEAELAPSDARLARLDLCLELCAARREAIDTVRGDWSQLARLYQAQADAAVEAAERARALCRAADVVRTRLSNGDAARQLLRAALAACPDDFQVARQLEAAARESASAAEEVRAMLAGAARECGLGAPAVAAELWLRAALIDAAVRRDPAGAAHALEQVRDPVGERGTALIDRIEREGAPAPVDALARLSRRTGDRAREKRALIRSLEWAAEGDRVALHLAIAGLAAADGDDEAAAWHRRTASRLEPRPASPAGFRVPAPDELQRDRAAHALADRCWREQRWHELDLLLAELLRGQAAAEEYLPAVELHHRAGHAALELGKFEQAARHFDEALAIDQVHLPALAGRAVAAAELGRWEEAHELYGAALLVQRSLARPSAELAETLYRMGEAREKVGLPRAALTLYESALDVHPSHRGALDAACRSYRESGDLHAVDRLLQAALPRTDRRRRADLLIELAGLASRFFDDPDGAVTLTRQALTLAPGERRLLFPLVEHCQAAGQWREAIEGLTQLAEVETSAIRRGRYLHAAGRMAAQLAAESPDGAEPAAAQAIEFFEQAIDCTTRSVLRPLDASASLAPFRDLEALLRRRADWKRLERAYRAMIERLGTGAPELASLRAELHALEREHLGRADRPADPQRPIDLYQGAGPDELDKLVERRRRLLEAEPLQPEHYSALRSLFVKSKNRDGTFAACRALAFLDRADRQEEEFYRRYRSDSVTWPVRAMKSADWRKLRHPDEDPLVAAVFALSAERTALPQATTARRLRLRDDSSAELDNVRRLFRSTSAALGVAEPGVFVTPAMEADAVLANLRRGSGLAPAFAIGRLMYQGRTSSQMVHTMARALAYVRPHAYLRLLLGPSTRVASAFAAACAIGGGPSDGAAADEVAEFAAAIRARAGRVWLSELRGAVHRLIERGSQVDVGRYCRGVDATARRAGLLLGGALDVAAADLHREPTFARRRPRDERLADLLVHSVSAEHLGLRRDLGLALPD